MHVDVPFRLFEFDRVVRLLLSVPAAWSTCPREAGKLFLMFSRHIFSPGLLGLPGIEAGYANRRFSSSAHDAGGAIVHSQNPLYFSKKLFFSSLKYYKSVTFI
jgi:hypothetical protein